MICPPSPCENSAGLDVAFLLDRTRSLGSLKNYRLLKGFLLEIVDALKVGANATRIGIVSFARTANVLNKFDDSNYHSNEALLHHLIKNIPNKLGNRTFIDLALEAANEQLFTEEGGGQAYVSQRSDSYDGWQANKDSKDYSEIIPLLKEKEVHIVAVGFGKKIFPEELEKITENKKMSTTWTVSTVCQICSLKYSSKHAVLMVDFLAGISGLSAARRVVREYKPGQEAALIPPPGGMG
ncbi:von Willebrand factor type A domain [Desmophyllum pertusum]|uniref:von Willebrand factor type A domain n=1 Tax=Desmophyllum pertusum TaxID=174260 RepID=A0A9X0CLP3_9CNID|nr:von Willebrand factor type A domain [Desmophyllum pertusum]